MKGERKSRKEVLRRTIIGGLLGAAGFLILVIGAILQEHGVESNYLVFFGIFVVVELIALFFELSVVKDGFRYDIEDKMSVMPLFLKNLSKEETLKTFQQHGFQKTHEEVWLKAISSLTLGFFQFFARWVRIESASDELVEATIYLALDDMKQLEQSDPRSEKKNGILCLFLEVDNMSEEIWQSVRELSQQLIFGAFTLPFQKVKTLIIILVDKTTHQGCFWVPLKSGNLYGRGCKLLKKYFT